MRKLEAVEVFRAESLLLLAIEICCEQRDAKPQLTVN